MNIIFQIALGGAIGAVLRFLCTQAIVRYSFLNAPFGTMLVNIIGSFLMGVLVVWILERDVGIKFSPLILTGVLGGFTTFSAFSLDAFNLWEQGRQVMAAAYVTGSVIGALCALFVGVIVMRAILT